MGSYITLNLNDVDVDWSKNGVGRSHFWLFPPGSLGTSEYEYAHGVREIKPAYVTQLSQAAFRLRHLGYSLQETRVKFELARSRWNRTSELRLTFDDFVGALTSIDFEELRSPENRKPPWEFRTHLLGLLSDWDAFEAGLDDFLLDLDVNITLRSIAERKDNLAMPLAWQFQDLVDGGWASIEDLADLDLPMSQMNQTILYGRLMDYSGAETTRAFDTWLGARGLLSSTVYSRMSTGGRSKPELTTLPTAVRHMIHHPENPFNSLTESKVRSSIEQLLTVAESLPVPLPNLN